jgi:omega-amidase
MSIQNFKVISLEEKSTKEYEKNLAHLIEVIKCNESVKLIVAPEVFLSDFDYEQMEIAAHFSLHAMRTLEKALLPSQVLVLTLILQEENGYVNQAIMIANNRVVYRQNKSKLFTLGAEEKYFTAGKKESIKPFKVEGVTFAILICFELRFKELWKQIEGADIVIIPAMWGKLRKHHLQTLSKALAVMNQCYVVVSNSANETMGGGSAIITPDGKMTNSAKVKLSKVSGEVNLKEVEKMRRYIIMK